MTYGGVSLTFLAAITESGNKNRAELWYLLAPTTGTANVVLTMGANKVFVAGATSFSGVSQGTPFGTPVTVEGSGGASSVTVSSAANEVVLDVVAFRDRTGGSENSGQTARWTNTNGSGSSDAWGGSSTEPGAASVTMGWTSSGAGAGEFSAIGVAIKPAPTTTLATGTDPGNTSLAPGGAATMADAFTFQTSSGTDAITAVTVTLAAGTSGGLSLVEITNNAGRRCYGSVSNPGSDTPAITLGTSITATTTLTHVQDPRHAEDARQHAGAGRVELRGDGARSRPGPGPTRRPGADTAGTTVTIDNLSPGNVTASTVDGGQ